MVLPRFGRTKVRRVEISDQVLLGDHQPVAELGQERELAGVADLIGPVDQVRAITPEATSLVVGQQLDRRGGAERARDVGAEVGRDKSTEADRVCAAQRRNRLEHIDLRSGDRAGEDPRVDDHGHRRARAPRVTKRASERTAVDPRR